MILFRKLLKKSYRIYTKTIYLLRLPIIFPVLFGLDPFILDIFKGNSKVIHIGASVGQERYLYHALGLSVLWVE